VNRAAESISGYSRQELLQMRLDDIVAPDQSDVAARIRESIASGRSEAAFYELDIVRKDGSRVTLENSIWPMHDGGRTVGFQGVARDVTERKRLQEQLRVAQKMEVVGRLAGGIAHDFGNILTIINGYCSMILSRGPHDEALRSEVLGIQGAGQRAASLIRHLLTFSKVQIVRPRLINVDYALAEMKDVLQRLVGENVQLSITVRESTGSIRFDPIQLEQVIVNLVLNARDSMPSGGRISIEARVSNEQWVCITVTDTGYGMPPEVLSQIFEPFFSTKEQGTGLGLSTVHSIIEQAGGSIKAASEPYAGTTITVLLPRVEDTHDHSPPSAQRSVPKGTGTILLVEDEDEVRILVKQMLRTSGYTVLEAADQNHAREICRNLNQTIDVMLTDVVMPRISGPQLAAEVRSIRPELKVIYMSGYPRDRFEQDGYPNILHFIQKPLTPEDLRALVRDVISGAAKSQPAET
jgi:PAS domain S-box-containing protein